MNHNIDKTKKYVYSYDNLKGQVIWDFVIAGPFIPTTQKSFEESFMYAREEILLPDYLESNGGENTIKPYDGMVTINPVLGKKQLVWYEQKAEHGWGKTSQIEFRFLSQEDIYKTPQRNAIFYAVIYVECEKEEQAFINLKHSGVKIFVNGLTVLENAYGRTKGANLDGDIALLNFKKGTNCILIKTRTGFIADGIDFLIDNVKLMPVVINNSGFIVGYPQKESLFTDKNGTVEQLYRVYMANDGIKQSDNMNIALGIDGDTDNKSKIGELTNENIKLMRIPMKNNNNRLDESKAIIELSNNEEIFSYEFCTTPDTQPESIGKAYAFSAFHFDTTYYEDQRTYQFGAFDTLRNYMELFRKDPGYKAFLSEVDYLHPYYSLYGKDRELLKQMHLEGRAESDCFYNQPNELSSSGEGLVRNMVYGQLYHKNVLGRKCYIYSPGDVFGHPSTMSSICAKGECSGIIWHKFMYNLPPLFRHVSPDGSYLIHNRGGALTPEDAKTLGVHVATSTTPSIENSAQWFNELIPRHQMAVLSEYFETLVEQEDQIIEKTGTKVYPLNSRDISVYHVGVALSRTNLKMANRLGETLLLDAEKFASLAGTMGCEYPELQLDKAWRQLLCGQHHDSITGTHCEMSYVDLMIEYREAVEAGADIVNRSLSYISNKLGGSRHTDGVPLYVFNAHNWERNDLVQISVTTNLSLDAYKLLDSDDNIVEFTIKSTQNKETKESIIEFMALVPSIGYSAYELVPSEISSQVTTKLYNKNIIENDYFKITVNPDMGGGITSIYDKKAKKEVINKAHMTLGNRICVLEERPDRCEPPHELFTTGLKTFSTEYPATVKLQKTANYEKLIIDGKIGHLCEFRQEITLNNNSDKIDCKTYITDYQSKGHLFTLTFPIDIQGAAPTLDDRFAAVVKTAGVSNLDFRTHQFMLYSGSSIYNADRWFDYGKTIQIALDNSEGNYAQFPIGEVALMHYDDFLSQSASEQVLLALATKGVHVTPWMDYKKITTATEMPNWDSDIAHTNSRIILTSVDRLDFVKPKLEKGLSAKDIDKIIEKANNDEIASAFFIDTDNEWNKEIYTLVIMAKDANALLAHCKVIAKGISQDEALSVCCGIYNCEPRKVENYGVSILNKGTIACSIEKGDLMNMMLFHTAGWYGRVGELGVDDFVPERKSHVFEYSLYPHASSWKEAKTWQKAYDFNSQLKAKTSNAPAKTQKASKHSFVKVSDNVVLSSLKAAQELVAGFSGDEKELYERGLMARIIEPNGRNAHYSVEFDFDIKDICETNMLEDKIRDIPYYGNKFNSSLTNFGNSTFNIIPKLNDMKIDREIYNQSEIVSPIYLRSWEHNLGSMPTGYLSTAISFDKGTIKRDDKKLSFTIHAMNNYTQTPISGEFKLELPTGWSTKETILKYDIAPSGMQSYEIEVDTMTSDSLGQVFINYNHRDLDFYDVLEVGAQFEPQFNMDYTDGQLVCTIVNKSDQELLTSLAIASPMETWGATKVDNIALGEIKNYWNKVVVAPHSIETVKIDVCLYDTVPTAWWAVGKLAVNGRIYYNTVVNDNMTWALWTKDVVADMTVDSEYDLTALLKMANATRKIK